MNKWAIDRFAGVGPLLPQNFQLVGIDGDPMQLLYDMPLPLGEPHYAQMIKADKLEPINVYKPAGVDPITDEAAANAVKVGEERIERKPDGVHVYMTAIRSHFTPDIVRVKKGDKVHLHITNVEQAHDATHGFTIGSYDVHSSLEPGKHVDISFVADEAGHLPVLLHGVLLRPPPGNGRLLPGGTGMTSRSARRRGWANARDRRWAGAPALLMALSCCSHADPILVDERAHGSAVPAYRLLDCVGRGRSAESHRRGSHRLRALSCARNLFRAAGGRQGSYDLGRPECRHPVYGGGDDDRAFGQRRRAAGDHR